jgi:hypothetical protein
MVTSPDAQDGHVVITSLAGLPSGQGMLWMLQSEHTDLNYGSIV